MSRLTLGWCASFAVIAGGAVSIASAQQPRLVDDNALKNAAKNSGEWLTHGRDYAETHHSPLKQIDTTNAQRLGLARSGETESPSGGRIESTPLESNGVIYGSPASDVQFAVDARTGKFRWRWDPEIAREHISQICRGPANRDVAIYDGRVYAGLLDGRLVALNQETGKLLWQVKTTDNPGTFLYAKLEQQVLEKTDTALKNATVISEQYHPELLDFAKILSGDNLKDSRGQKVDIRDSQGRLPVIKIADSPLPIALSNPDDFSVTLTTGFFLWRNSDQVKAEIIEHIEGMKLLPQIKDTQAYNAALGRIDALTKDVMGLSPTVSNLKQDSVDALIQETMTMVSLPANADIISHNPPQQERQLISEIGQQQHDGAVASAKAIIDPGIINNATALTTAKRVASLQGQTQKDPPRRK